MQFQVIQYACYILLVSFCVCAWYTEIPKPILMVKCQTNRQAHEMILAKDFLCVIISIGLSESVRGSMSTDLQGQSFHTLKTLLIQCLCHNHPKGLIMKGLVHGFQSKVQTRFKVFFPKRDRAQFNSPHIDFHSKSLIIRMCGPLVSTFQELFNDMWNFKI